LRSRQIHSNLDAMNTQSHVIMGAVLFGRGVPRTAWAGALGGFVPDVPMLLIVLGLKSAGVADRTIFGELYWQNWWQVSNAIGHNVWLWGGLIVLGLVMRDRLSASTRSFDGWTLVAMFAGSALLHTVIDLLCHREDAHMSFWPVTRWKFMSPVSYYDPQHYGQYFSFFEAALGIVLAIVLFRQFKSLWLRLATAVAMLLYVAVPAYFILL
jgi:hypothetical protein